MPGTPLPNSSPCELRGWLHPDPTGGVSAHTLRPPEDHRILRRAHGLEPRFPLAPASCALRCALPRRQFRPGSEEPALPPVRGADPGRCPATPPGGPSPGGTEQRGSPFPLGRSVFPDRVTEWLPPPCNLPNFPSSNPHRTLEVAHTRRAAGKHGAPPQPQNHDPWSLEWGRGRGPESVLIAEQTEPLGAPGRHTPAWRQGPVHLGLKPRSTLRCSLRSTCRASNSAPTHGGPHAGPAREPVPAGRPG